QRKAVSRPHRTAARGRGAAGGAVGAHRALRVQPPTRAGRDARHSAVTGRRARGSRRPARRRAQAGRDVLPRHGAAARDRERAPRRPPHAAAGRAGERSRPGRHPLDAEPADVTRRRGPRSVRLVAPDERDVPDGGAPDRHRPRPPDRRHDGGRLHPQRVETSRAREVATGASAARPGGARRGDRDERGTGAHADRGDDGSRGRRRRRDAPDRAARADACTGVARGGVHGAHARRGRVQGTVGGPARVERTGACGRMTAATRVAIPRLGVRGRVTQWHVVRSEWVKLYSLRSTRWSLGAAAVLTIGFSCLFAAILSSHWGHMNPNDRANQHPLDVAQAGINISQLAIMVLGVLMITGEYSTGMIRASLTAVPKRLPVLWAKLAVYAVVAFLFSLPLVLAAFFASQAILSRHHILQISFSHAGVARAVVGGAVYLTLIGLFAMALGAIVRNTAGGIATFVGLFFVIPPLLNVLPTHWQNAVNPWIPNSAARSIFQLTHGPHSLSPAGGLAVTVGYTAAAAAVAAILLLRRDA